MSLESSVYLLFLITAIALLEIVLLIVNYKGRFKYGMYEQTSIWRRFDKQRGIIRYLYFPVSFFYTVVIVPFLLTILGAIALGILQGLFNFLIPLELVLSSLFGVVIGVLLFNQFKDKFSVRCFETCYRTCGHNRECATFRAEACILPHGQHNGEVLLSLLEQKEGS